MLFRTFVLAGLVTGVGGAARAQVMHVTYGTYYIIAEARAHTESQLFQDGGDVAQDHYSHGMQASASFDDPNFGLHTAYGAAGLAWETSTSSLITTLSGHVGGVAEAMSNGLETYATGGAAVSINFDVTQQANARLESQGTYNTDIYVFDGSAWQPYETGLNGVIERVMDVGMYRVTASAGESVSGSSYYSSGIDFSVRTEAVPEPASIAGLSIGAIALLRRRRRS